MIPEPLRIPAFRAYWLARLTSTIAQMAMVIVIGWQVYDIARETMGLKEAAFRLGLIGLVQFVPLFALTLVTGWAADRVDRRWIARAAVLLELACAAALAWYAWTGTTTLMVLYVVAALLGVARAFAGPGPRRAGAQPGAARNPAERHRAVVDRLAGRRDRRPGARRLSVRRGARSRPYAASALLFAVALIGLMAIGPVARPDLTSGPSPWTQMVEGLRYVRRNRLVLGAISLDLFAVLLGGATAMLPVFARDVLHAGPEGLGHLRAAPAVGATLTAAFFAVRPLKTNVGVKMLVAVGVFGARDDRLRLVAIDAAVAGLPGAARRGRHVLGLCPPIADPALHARRDARPGRRGLVLVHFRVERAWRSRIRLPRRAHRAGRRRSSPEASERSWWSRSGPGNSPSCGLQEASTHPM